MIAPFPISPIRLALAAIGACVLVVLAWRIARGVPIGRRAILAGFAGFGACTTVLWLMPEAPGVPRHDLAFLVALPAAAVTAFALHTFRRIE
jgi:hypothetical protein